MYYLQEICSFCLKESIHLKDMFSTDQHGVTQFDKIAFSLTRVVNVLKLHDDLLLCDQCCEKIDMIYNFNQTSLENIDTFTSYKNILQGQNLERQRCYVRVKLEKNYGINSQSVSIKAEKKIYSHSQNNHSTGHQNIEYIATKGESETAQKTFLKFEMEDSVQETFGNDDYDFDSIAYSKIKIEIEEKNLKKECFGEDKGLKACEEASTTSKAAVGENVEEHILDTNDETSYHLEETECKDDPLCVDKKSLDKKDQLLVRNKQICKNKKYACHVCQKIFIRKGSLTVHLRIHFGVRPYSCNICEKAFNQKCVLARHMLIHSGEKTHICGVCKKIFSQKGNLNSHMLIHSGIKPFSCDVCDKSFTQKISLVKHQRIHTGDKPYACDLCDKAFSQQSNLIQHRRLHTGERPYSCGICNKTFAQQAGLISHTQSHIH